MTKDIFVGVDGGGTKSTVRIVDSEGQVLGQASSGPANIRLSVDQAWHSIYDALTKILQPLRLSLDDANYRFHAGLGLAGSEVPAACQAYLARPHAFTTIELVSDAHIACLGAHGGKDGAIIVVGTGVIGYQTLQGKHFRVAGWGFPHDDEGGGAWLGLAATRLTLKWLDDRGLSSPLIQAIWDKFSQTQSQLVAWANHANATEFAQLVPLVLHYAGTGDEVAVTLLQTAANYIDDIAAALAKQAGVLPCCLVGGMAPFILPYLSLNLRQRLVAPQGDACQGALDLIRAKSSNGYRSSAE
ncbi:MAG: hypothetical protein A3E83_02970 [Gammaproteobacteria bacterium RIFCSPHIGHO2_12_FULL_41_20]|nr:MAG: hypothetical protein A3E83_02970 [Gammaproteobacteria bacterium RIFCSPHIGHO2_12_FULL_41_20]